MPNAFDDIYISTCSDLERAVKDRNHDYRIVNVASVNANATAEVRAVVLRKFDAARRSIIFHTDIRSAKVQQIRENPQITIHAYSKSLKTQLRFKAFAHVHNMDELAGARWADTKDQGRKCYSGKLAEGTELAEAGDGLDGVQGRAMTDADQVRAKENFAVIVCNYSALDYLYLDSVGHIRAELEWDAQGEMAGKWLVP